jgi:ubiquinone/menaquinone biosynthesis C-methylase UbiE
MAIFEHPILLPILRLLVGIFIGRDNLRLYETCDWEQERSSSGAKDYPEYYRSQDFHGIRGGYLNAIAPVTYDAVARFAAPPNEIKQRAKAIAAVKDRPCRILDLGCGTGSSTLMLKQEFPQAEVIGLDISPYMLTMAEHKGRKVNLAIEWQPGKAEATKFADNRFDLVSIAFLFHETPVKVSREILQECQRLLRPGGQIIVLDGNQQRLRHANWLIKLFREPYSQAYAAGNVDNWLNSAGFVRVETQYVGWISQLTTGFIL